MRDYILYRFLKSLQHGRCLMLLAIILLIVADPIIKINTHLSEEKYELCENNEEEKKANYNEDDNEELYSTHTRNSELGLKKTVRYYYFQKQFTDFNPRILIPPPQS